MSPVARRPADATSTSSPRTSPSPSVSTTSPSLAAGGGHLDTEPDVDARARSDAATASPAAGSRVRQQPVVALEQGDRGAERLPGVAISQPTYPPPTTSSRPGTSFALVASRGVHGATSASPSIGRDGGLRPGADGDRVPGGQPRLGAVGPGDDDGALAVEPAGAAHQVDAGALHPLHLPGVVPVPVKESRRARVAATSCSPVTACAAPSTARASASTSVPRSSALLGMQAQ
jgi:hypothetical protein